MGTPVNIPQWETGTWVNYLDFGDGLGETMGELVAPIFSHYWFGTVATAVIMAVIGLAVFGVFLRKG